MATKTANRKAAAPTAEAADNVEAPAPKEYGVTKAQLIADRKAGLSWAKVAQKHSLGAPNSARRAWVAVVGTPHTEAPQVQRAKASGNGEAGNGWEPCDFTAETTITALRKVLAGHELQVQPSRKNGQVRVVGAVKIAKYAKAAGTVDIIGADGETRTVALAKVSGRRPLA